MPRKSLSRSSTKTALPNPIPRNSNVLFLIPSISKYTFMLQKNCDLIKLATGLSLHSRPFSSVQFPRRILSASFNHTEKRFCSRTKLQAANERYSRVRLRSRIKEPKYCTNVQLFHFLSFFLNFFSIAIHNLNFQRQFFSMIVSFVVRLLVLNIKIRFWL